MDAHTTPKRRRVTLTEIASALGVSPATVSNAYNRPDQLSPALRQQILETAAQMGYGGPDPVARGLRRRRAGAVGVLYAEQLSYAFLDPAAVLVLQGVAMATEAAGLGLLLVPGLPLEAETPEMVGNAIVDGFIVYSMAEDDPLVDVVLARHLPTVFVDQPPRGDVPFVGIDDEGGAQQATDHLLGLGHRRFGIIADRLTHTMVQGWATPERLAATTFLPIRSRLRGYRAAVLAAGLAWDAVAIYEVPYNNEDHGYIAAQAMLTRTPRPTALLAFSDRLAFGAVRAAHDLGLAVPGDLSVVGFDDIPATAQSAPPLTTVQQPHVEKGRRAGQLLIAQLHDAPPPASDILPTRLIVRGSSGPPP